MYYSSRHYLALALLLALLMSPGHAQEADPDPWQWLNRKTYAFNVQLDRYLLRPAARVYKHVPVPVRRSVSNFFDHLGEPYTVANDLLQGKPGKALRDTGRFTINTILGFGGLFDPATEIGFPREPEDFGQTLAVWGVPDGPYLVLPLFGPSSLRDAVGLAPGVAVGDPLSQWEREPERWYAQGLSLVDTRTQLLGYDKVLEQQPDPYLFVRQAYLNRRMQMVNDSAEDADAAHLDDELLDLLDEQ